LAPLLQADTAALQKELIIYEKGIPELLEVDKPFWSLLEKTDVDPTSNRVARIPLLQKAGGAFQQANMDNASLGAGTGPVWIVATLAPIYFTHAVSMSKLAEYATAGANRAVRGALRETIDVTLRQFTSALDMVSNTGGNGVLGTITSVAAAVYTLTTDGFKASLFYNGMPVQVFNAALTTDRGSTTITAIDRAANTVTVAASPGGTIATDLLVIEGLAAPVTIQSSLFGIQYHQSDATTGLWMNVDRATTVEVRTPSVSAASSLLTTAPIRRALNKIREYWGDDNATNEQAKLIAYMHPAQADQYEATAITISSIFKDPTGNQGVDRLFNNRSGLTMSNVPVRQSIHADRTRIDFMCLSKWGRIQGTDIGFYKVGDQYLFPAYMTSGDGLVSSQFFYYKLGLQIYNRNPIANSFIKALTVPQNY